MKHIPKIVITGGPCGGKSSAQGFLSTKFRELGYYPVFVPEAPTMLINAGITPVGGVVPLQVFEEHVIDLMIRLEDGFEDSLRKMNHPKPIVICDRGLMDTKAYMPEEMFWEVVTSRGLGMADMCDRRYLGVFHLRTTAIGAEKYYTRANNTARIESVEEARIADERTLQAWVGHPNLAVIDNIGKNFDEKMEVLWKKICRVLGEPEPVEIERKFLVKPVNLDELGIPNQTINVEQVYLSSAEPKSVLRIRKRTQHDSSTYFETTKRHLESGINREEERYIDPEEYALSLRYKEENSVVLKKIRQCFVWNNQYFELDTFEAPHAGLCILELELTEINDPVDLPPFIDVIKEVTGDPNYSNHFLASGVQV